MIKKYIILNVTLIIILYNLGSDDEIILEMVIEPKPIKSEDCPNEKAFVNPLDEGFVKAEEEATIDNRYMKDRKTTFLYYLGMILNTKKTLYRCFENIYIYRFS